MMTVRDARPGDGARLAAMWREGAEYYAERFPDDFMVPRAEGLAEWFEDDLRRDRSATELWLVAEIDGELAGFLWAQLTPPIPDADRQMLPALAHTRLSIEALGAARAYQRRGVATVLVAAAEAWGRERGATFARATTYYASEVSIPFWEQRAGYARRGITFAKRLA